MALHIHRADRTDILADGLGNCLPARPRTRSLRISSSCLPAGWNAGYPSGSRIGWAADRGAMVSALGFRSGPRVFDRRNHRYPEDDPWSPEAMTWPPWR